MSAASTISSVLKVRRQPVFVYSQPPAKLHAPPHLVHASLTALHTMTPCLASAGLVLRDAAAASVPTSSREQSPLPSSDTERVPAGFGRAADWSLCAADHGHAAHRTTAAPTEPCTACSGRPAGVEKIPCRGVSQPRAASLEPVPVSNPGQRDRPDLMSDIEALRQRWGGVACDPRGGHDISPPPLPLPVAAGPFLGDVRVGQLRHDGAASSAPADRLRGGGAAGFGRFGLLPEPSARQESGDALRFMTLRSSYPGAR